MRQQRRTQTKPPQRLEKEKLIQDEIDQKLTRYAQLKFVEHVYKNFELETQKERQTQAALIPAHYFFGDAVRLALHW